MSSVLVYVASYWCCRWCLFSSLFLALFLSCCKLMFAGMAMATEVYPSRICCYLQTSTQIWSAAVRSNAGLLGFDGGTKSELHADEGRRSARDDDSREQKKALGTSFFILWSFKKQFGWFIHNIQIQFLQWLYFILFERKTVMSFGLMV